MRHKGADALTYKLAAHHATCSDCGTLNVAQKVWHETENARTTIPLPPILIVPVPN